MKKIKFFSFLLAACLTVGLLAVPASALNDPDVRAKAVLLADLDLENPMQCLLTRPHTYLVVKSKFAPHLQTWLQEHYTPTATLQQTATVNVYTYGDTPIWQAVA